MSLESACAAATARAEECAVEYRRLGDSDLLVSEVALGSWLTYGAGVARDQAIACVRRALDVGITLLDTANVYGGGGAESLLAAAPAGVERSSTIPANSRSVPSSR